MEKIVKIETVTDDIKLYTTSDGKSIPGLSVLELNKDGKWELKGKFRLMLELDNDKDAITETN